MSKSIKPFIYMGWIFISILYSQTTEKKMEATPKPPVAKIVPKDVTVHNDKRIDNYFWLRERESKEVLDYLKAENAYTKSKMKHTKDLQQKLFLEMKSRIKETDSSVPVKKDDYYYYRRVEKGKQYPIYCRKKGNLDGKEQVLLDGNKLAEGLKYMDIGVFKISPDHKYLAYSVDDDGSEKFTIYVKDLDSGKLLSEKIVETSYSLEWAADNNIFFYNTLDAALRPYKVFRHVLGNEQVKDKLIYHEKDDAYFLDISKSKSGKYLFLVANSAVTSEIHYLKATTPLGKFAVFHPRQQDMEYSVEHHGNRFFIVTNDHAANFKLMEAPVNAPQKKNWKDVIAHRPKVKIDSIEVFKEHMVVFERENGLRQILIIELDNGKKHRVEFPEAVYAIYNSSNPDFNTTLLRFQYTSMVTPRSIFDYDMSKKTRELKKQDQIPGGYEKSLYHTERLFAVAPDGVKIPISIVYKKGIAKNGKNPFYLYGYGSYGYTIEPKFSSNRLTLLDRGFVFAIAHIRGGGTMGRQWYENGKYLKKRNTFTDFIACAEHVIKEKYTSSDYLVINGGSAGGLLMGAVTNMRPDLFKAVIADVPFVDVVNTMLDPTIPLTVTEYEEWGNPQDKTYYEYMKNYSPYDNVKSQNYPNMLITAGLNDPRVQYWEPAKWTAKLRATKTDNNLLLLKINMGSGHSGSSGRYDYLKEIAFEFAFVFDILKIK